MPNNKAKIDETAKIDPSAKIGSNVTIGAFSIIGPNVEIGENTWVGPHVVIARNTRIGKNNKIYQFSSVGEDPQDLKFKGEETWLEIGDNNLIREGCTLSRGTAQAITTTKIGSNNLLMAYVHIAHDCILGDNNILANNVTLAGHVIIENDVTIGGFAVFKQFVRVGSYSFIAATAGVTKDVMPYVIISNHHGGVSKAYGLNLVGLKRKGFNSDTIRKLQAAYKIIFNDNLTVAEALPKLEAMLPECPEVERMITMLRNSKIGVTREL
jgi:UDP-N-acetylglucosamine acyltransferase